jgi:hypothetical protein
VAGFLFFDHGALELPMYGRECLNIMFQNINQIYGLAKIFGPLDFPAALAP